MFEFDELKSQSNFKKHGIDFLDAQKLWNDPNLIIIRARSEGEERFMIIGMINENHWSGIITYRANNIRLISVRRSRIKEIELYES